MKLSVVIPCRNAARTIGDTLDVLAAQQWPDEWEIIVADNGSTDGLAAVIDRYRRKMPTLRLVDASAKRGASHARNVGVQAATGEGMLFCDADDLPAEGWATAMERALRGHAFVACRLEYMKLNSENVRSARGAAQTEVLQKFKFLPFPHAGSGTLGIHRTLHEAVGGFDETIPICEDVDYCMRVQQTGVRLELVPDAELHYRLRNHKRLAYTQAVQYAEYEVYLYKKYGSSSLREWWRWRQYGHAWWYLLSRVPELMRTPNGKTILVWKLGRQVGLLKGCVRFGAPPVFVE